MSIKLMSKIWEHPELARGQTIVTKDQKEVDQQNKLRTMKMVLLCLADMANDDGVCWPSNKTIAERSNLTPDYVRNIMGTLRANGWLTTTERFSETGKRTSNWVALDKTKISTPQLVHPSDLVGGTPPHLVHPTPPHLVGGTIEPSLDSSLKERETPSPTAKSKSLTSEETTKTPPPVPFHPPLAVTAHELTQRRAKSLKYCQEYNWQIHRPTFEAIVDAMGKQALVNADNDRTIGDLQQAAVTLTKAGVSAETIIKRTGEWKASWIGQRNGSASQFIEFMGTASAVTASGQAAPALAAFTGSEK
jgi:hypothetical protein